MPLSGNLEKADLHSRLSNKHEPLYKLALIECFYQELPGSICRRVVLLGKKRAGGGGIARDLCHQRIERIEFLLGA